MGAHAYVPVPSVSSVKEDSRCGLKVSSFTTHQTKLSFSGNMRYIHGYIHVQICVCPTFGTCEYQDLVMEINLDRLHPLT